MNQNTKDILIEKLTEMYIKSYEEDKKGNKVYIHKTTFLGNFIKFIKEYL